MTAAFVVFQFLSYRAALLITLAARLDVGIHRHFHTRRRMTAAAAGVLGLRPFFGQRFKHVRRFVADDILPLGHRTNQPAKDRLAAQAQVRAAIVDPDLRMHPVELFGLFKVADANFAVTAAGHNTIEIFGHRGFVTERGERKMRPPRANPGGQTQGFLSPQRSIAFPSDGKALAAREQECYRPGAQDMPKISRPATRLAKPVEGVQPQLPHGEENSLASPAKNVMTGINGTLK